MSLTFINDGEIDIFSVTSFGVSVKDSDSAIGYFGTGLKYAIAISLRNGCGVKIMSGVNCYDFGLVDKTFRGKNFKAVTMAHNGNVLELAFTTELGKNWENWQAFREIYSNMLDEKGFCIGSLDNAPEKGKTKILISGEVFNKYFNDAGSYFLQATGENISKMSGVEIFQKPADTLFYKGVAVAKCEPSLFTYNVTFDVTLTEDRTIKFYNDYISLIPRAISSLTDKVALKKLLYSKSNFETDIDYSDLHWALQNRSEIFDEVIGDAYKNNSDKINKSAIRLFSKIKNTTAKDIVPVTPTEYEQKMIMSAVEILGKFSDIGKREIIIVETLGENTLGLAINETIVISRKCFDQGLKYLTSTIYEEFVHLETGYCDETREMQTYLFDKIITIVARDILNIAL